LLGTRLAAAWPHRPERVERTHLFALGNVAVNGVIPKQRVIGDAPAS
jgi:hypothetical protein